MKVFRHDLLVAFFAITAFLCFIPVFTYVYFAADLSPQATLVGHNDSGVVLLDNRDKPFFTFYQAKLKKETPLSSIPKMTQQAVISVEDKNFYSHPGFSITAIFRSFMENIQGRSLSYGGSTITQQLVKNSLLTPKKSFLRKFQEIVLASEIERRYTKNQILEMYLNSVYFGEGSFGIEEASQVYFNKSVKDLDLAQSTLLAAILPAPSQLSPLHGNLIEVKRRQEIVLGDMVKQGFINSQQKDQVVAENIKLNVNGRDVNSIAPHFALMVKDELIKKYGEELVIRSGFKVKTTLDLDWQKYAQDVVAKQVKNLKVHNVSNGAAVVMDPKTSEVRALVGSINWYDNKFGKVNITVSDRPPGSAFKPIVYIKAFEEGIITPATILKDEPTSFANFDESSFYDSFPSRSAALANLAKDPNAFYKPVDYDRKYRGSVTARRALSNSLNIPSVAVMKKVGVKGALDSAKNLGITTLFDPSNYGLSLVLGAGEVKPLELVNAYAVFASGGLRNDPTLILEITDKAGNIVYKYQPKQEQVIDPKYTFLISSILSDNKTRAEVFGNSLNISRPAAVKTGTTEDFKDAWTVGYTPSLVVGVWVGNNYNASMDGVAGSLGAAPIWRDLMEKFLKGTPVEQFIPPEGIVKFTGCGATEYFIKGTEPKPCISKPSIATPKP
ncbi:PBP1A family penicillin-binding protein [Candidatus Daviesbacteria bacterium]|nr:PBP1A family penicillin-binding protein [Candidatus Daviesbacteria bacterium]